MTERWKPSDYHNTYHEDLMARIEQKVKEGETHEITKPEKEEGEERPTAKIFDLAELLKQSVGKDKGSKKRPRVEAEAESVADEEPARRPAARRKAASTAAPIRLAKASKPPLHAVAAKRRAPAKRKRA